MVTREAEEAEQYVAKWMGRKGLAKKVWKGFLFQPIKAMLITLGNPEEMYLELVHGDDNLKDLCNRWTANASKAREGFSARFPLTEPYFESWIGLVSAKANMTVSTLISKYVDAMIFTGAQDDFQFKMKMTLDLSFGTTRGCSCNFQEHVACDDTTIIIAWSMWKSNAYCKTCLCSKGLAFDKHNPP